MVVAAGEAEAEEWRVEEAEEAAAEKKVSEPVGPRSVLKGAFHGAWKESQCAGVPTFDQERLEWM